jgi:hypothetical protein
MAEIIFSRKTIAQAKDKVGLYRDKPKRIVQSNIIPFTISRAIEAAFREYARKHKGCTAEIENREWSYFKSVLQRYL